AATRTQIFEISQEDSLASFEIDEVLRGSPFTAIGLTNQIAGQIAFDPNDLSDAQIGTISINARTFLTDNEFRNRALNNRILLTGIYEFIEFVPTALNGLPDSVAIGETVEFEIVGQLTLLDTTKEETFAATVMFDSAETISGIATTTILRSNYDLQIPAVRAVASVEDEVTLTLEFVANAQ
ncbi:MAG TPA: YceI family protein, partial [Anaerolineae bacterium]|nr:YceI family protein [Anaerolineae bacterium]